MPLASAAGRTASSAASTTVGSFTGRSSSRILPVTMREISRRSSTSRIWAVALRSMASSARSVRAGSSVAVLKIRAQPYTALSGVRSSWESRARNSSLARLAVSASARADCALAIASSNARATAVTSCGPFRAAGGGTVCPWPNAPTADDSAATGRAIRWPTSNDSTRAATRKPTPPPATAQSERRSGPSMVAGGIPSPTPQPVTGDRLYAV
jgi:hypothetical protein